MLTYTIMSSRIVYFPSFFPFFCIIHHHASSYIHLFHFFLNLGHILFMRKCHRRRGGEINLMYRAGRVHFSCCQLALSRRYCMVFFFLGGGIVPCLIHGKYRTIKKKASPFFLFFLLFFLWLLLLLCGNAADEVKENRPLHLWGPGLYKVDTWESSVRLSQWFGTSSHDLLGQVDLPNVRAEKTLVRDNVVSIGINTQGIKGMNERKCLRLTSH